MRVYPCPTVTVRLATREQNVLESESLQSGAEGNIKQKGWLVWWFSEPWDAFHGLKTRSSTEHNLSAQATEGQVDAKNNNPAEEKLAAIFPGELMSD